MWISRQCVRLHYERTSAFGLGDLEGLDRESPARSAWVGAVNDAFVPIVREDSPNWSVHVGSLWICSIWMSIDDIVYDVTSFLEQHPGGKEYLLLAAGRDCTDLFKSYHPFTNKPYAVLKKYAIGTLSSRQFPKFKPDSGFYATLCKRVDEHFKKNGIDYKNPIPAFKLLATMIPLYILFYCLVFTPVFEKVFPFLGSHAEASHSLAWWAVKIVLALLFGWSQVMFLLHVMHDASHSSISHSESLWQLTGRFAAEAFIGSSMVSWHNQHVVGHHLYTNVFSADPDLPVVREGDLRLIAPQQGNSWVYKYQHIWLPVLYSLLTLKSRLQDYGIHSSRMNGPIPVNPITSGQWIRLAVSKFNFIVLRLLIPMYFMSVTDVLALFVVTELISGAYLAFNFQVSHVSEEAEFPVTDSIPASSSYMTKENYKVSIADKPDDKSMNGINKFHGFRSKNLKSDLKAAEKTVDLERALSAKPAIHKQWDVEWAELQVRSSLDYAHDSALCTWLCGALNYQTEHHLFPSVSQYLYPEIAPIVRKTCKEFNLPYNYVPGFWEAFMGHIKHLKKMAQDGKAYHPHY